MGSSQHSTLDARFAQSEASQRLQVFLRLVHTHPDIATWFYCDSPQTQRAAGILSPETFNRSVATSTQQSYTDLAVPIEPDACFSDCSENYIYTLYVPARECHGVALGYSFHTAVPCRAASLLKDIFPSLKTNRGRYVYQKDTRLLLIFIQNTATTDVVFYLQWTSDRSRRMHYFLVPHRKYGYDNPPKDVISTGGTDADSLWSFPSPTWEADRAPVTDLSAGEEALPNGPADFVDGVWEGNINSLPKCMFHDLEPKRVFQEMDNGRECASWLKGAQVRCLARLTGGLIQFETRRRGGGNGTPVCLMHGTFFSAHVVRDGFDETGALEHRKAFEVRTRAYASEGRCLNVLRKAAAQIYYSVVLWASTDQCLVAAQEQSAAEGFRNMVLGKEEEL